MVRGLTISSHGGPERLELRSDLAQPELRSSRDVRVRVHAAALNHLDLFVLEGLPGAAPTMPWILGADAAGVVDAVGAEVTSVRIGDRVMLNPGISDRTCAYCNAGEQPLCPKFKILGEHLPGTLAEHVVVPDANLRRVSSGVPFETAAAFTLATLTAWRMVVSRARVEPGEDVLIWGVGGGVALAALQICKLMGARVWVTSGSDAKLEQARRLGADELFNHRQTKVGQAVRERAGKRGIDVVIDNVGAATWTESLQCLGRGGRLVTCGGTSGPVVQTDVRRLFWNQWTILGSTMGNDAEFDAITAAFANGQLTPPVDSVFPLAEGRQAFERLSAADRFGKVVVDCTA